MANQSGSSFGGPTRKITKRMDRDFVQDVPETGEDVGAKRDRTFVYGVVVVLLLVAAAVGVFVMQQKQKEAQQQAVKAEFQGVVTQWLENFETGAFDEAVQIAEPVAIIDGNSGKLSDLHFELKKSLRATQATAAKTVVFVKTKSFVGKRTPDSASEIHGKKSDYISELRWLNLETDELSKPIWFTTARGQPQRVEEDEHSIIRNCENSFFGLKSFLSSELKLLSKTAD